MRRAILGGLATFALALVVFATPAYPAQANGVPQLVKLTYLDGVSNFGPRDAEGVLEFSFAEAYARVDVKNLTLVEGRTYEGWLTGGSAPLLVGQIPVNASGIGNIEAKLTGLSSYDYNMFVVAARGASTAEGAFPAEHSIAGRFTIIGDDPSNVGGDIRPGELPDTGEQAPMSTQERIGRALTVSAAAAGLAFGFIRIMRRKRVLA